METDKRVPYSESEIVLYQLTDVLQNAIETKEITLCPFLDIEGGRHHTQSYEIP